MARILVIDDVRGVRRSLVSILSRAGHEVTEAENGAEGIRLASSARYDVVVTDILMPEADGAEVITTLRRMPAPPRVVAISGGGVLVPTQEALLYARQAADAALEKPFEADELLAVVGRLLEDAA